MVKRYEKLTPAEALDRAKKTLIPYWFGTEPLIASFTNEQGDVIIHRDPAFTEKNWIIAFIDPLANSTRDFSKAMELFQSRFGMLKIGFLAVFKIPYSFCQEADWCRKQFSQSFPSGFWGAMDLDGRIASLFLGPSSLQQPLPRVIFLQQGKITMDRNGDTWPSGFEKEFQALLRKFDPGIPLSRPIEKEDPIPRDLPGVSVASSSPYFTLTGNWTKEGDAMICVDPNASLTIHAPAKMVGLVAQSTVGPVEVQVELPLDFPRQRIAGDDLLLDSPDKQGRSAPMEIRAARLYNLFTDLPLTHREVRLTFTNVGPALEQSKALIYGLRFSN